MQSRWFTGAEDKPRDRNGPTGEDGLGALELADAALRSSETGTLVRLGA